MGPQPTGLQVQDTIGNVQSPGVRVPFVRLGQEALPALQERQGALYPGVNACLVYPPCQLLYDVFVGGGCHLAGILGA